jgi:hypothetical protein
MKDPTVQCTPPEIWEMILQHAVATPILPFIDEGHNHLSTSVLKAEQLFPLNCHVYRQNLKREKMVKTLRLVCRMWASILAGFQEPCIFAGSEGIIPLDMDIKTLEGAERVHIIEKDFQDTCGCSHSFEANHCPYSYLSYDEHQANWLQAHDDISLQKLFGRVRILSLENWMIDTERLIKSMPKLRAIDITCPPEREEYKPPALSTLLSYQPNLTHLQVDHLKWQDFTGHFSTRNCRLVSLKYLALGFISYNGVVADLTDQKIEYNFPGLASLNVYGTLDFGVKKQFNQFLKQCGSSVTEFVNSCHFQKRYAFIPPEGLPPDELLPHLSLYGTLLSSITPLLNPSSQEKATPSQKISPSRILLIYAFRHGLQLDAERLASQLSSFMKTWGFKGALIDASWEDIKLDDTEFLWFNKFFTQIMKSSITFSDKNDIEVRDSRCQRFWEPNSP